MRRAQAEIIGLVLIVLLLGVGFLLYVKFSFSDSASPKASYESTALGQSFVNSLAKSDVAWCSQTISVNDLIRSIATGGETCSSGGDTQEAALTAYLKKALNQTFDVWGINYNLSIVRSGATTLMSNSVPSLSNPNVPARERCSVTMNRGNAHYGIVLHPNPGSVDISFDQCE